MSSYYHYIDSSNDIETFYHLIRDVYVIEKGYNINIPDEYTQTADHFLIKENNIAVAGFRINNDIKFHNTITEINQQAKYGEISRWAIRSAWRKKISIVKTFADFAHYANKNKLDGFIARVTLNMIDFYKRYGLIQLGMPHHDPEPFAKLMPDDTTANFQTMLLPTDVLNDRYLTV